MSYRINRKTGDRLSEIGIVPAYLYSAGRDEAVRALRRAAEGGINYFDLAAGEGTTFSVRWTWKPERSCSCPGRSSAATSLPRPTC